MITAILFAVDFALMGFFLNTKVDDKDFALFFVACGFWLGWMIGTLVAYLLGAWLSKADHTRYALEHFQPYGRNLDGIEFAYINNEGKTIEIRRNVYKVDRVYDVSRGYESVVVTKRILPYPWLEPFAFTRLNQYELHLPRSINAS